MRIEPAGWLTAAVAVPGDKSISRRAVLVAAVCDGETRIEGGRPGRLRGGAIASRGDHRIAILAAVAGLLAREGVEIDDPAVAISFPRFFDLVERTRAG